MEDELIYQLKDSTYKQIKDVIRRIRYPEILYDLEDTEIERLKKVYKQMKSQVEYIDELLSFD